MKGQKNKVKNDNYKKKFFSDPLFYFDALLKNIKNKNLPICVYFSFPYSAAYLPLLFCFMKRQLENPWPNAEII